MLVETNDDEEIIPRLAALDIGKADLVACVRLPSETGSGKRLQEVTTYSTMTRALLTMSDRFRCLGVTRVVMEATSDYWKPVFYLLEAAGFEVWLVNAKDVKHLPGRPKSDTIDAVWLCKVAERQMIRPSFVPPPEIRRLRDLTRYRVDLVGARTAEKNRVEKLLEDAHIKVSVVASDIFGVSGRAMLKALIAGERDPKVLAQMARSRMRTKIGALEEAFTGHFTGHHAYLLGKMVARVEAIEADIADLDHTIEAEIARFADTAQRLDEIPGVGLIAAPACADTGYRQDATDAGDPLLEVHHTDGDPAAAFARGARDHPSDMLALCRNCHGLVTHGHNRAALNLIFAAAAKDAHRRLLAHGARSGMSG
ncbi:IS110 family transposase [Nonomuraea fuscirosea]